MSTFVFDVTFGEPVIEVEFGNTATFDVEFVGVALPVEGGGAVDSVNGQTGTVTLTATDVGADASGTATTLVENHEDADPAHTAAQIAFTPTGGLAATRVSTALAELDTEKATTGSVTAAIATAAADATTKANAAQAASQPVDSDLTAIAALTTTSFGRSLLALADAAAGRTALALGSAATEASSAFDAAGAAAAAQAASQPVDSDLTAIAALTTTSFGRGLLALADAAALRSSAGLGTAAVANTGDFDAAGAAAAAQAASQPLDDDLTAIAALSTTSFGRGLLALADAAAGRSALGLGTAAVEAASSFQPVDSDLTAIAALSTTSFGRSLLEAADASALRTLAGLGTIATQAASNVSITGGSVTGITDVAVADGGTGASDASTARTNLGLGTIATQAASSVTITGGSVTGITDLAVADGGTGSSTAAAAAIALAVTPSDSWFASSDTWTYASATTFTIAGVDRTAVFTKGTRIKLTQTTAKYFVVVSSSFSTNTTVTVTGGTDYTVANAAITSPYYSYAACPPGYPTFFNWSPTVSGWSADPANAVYQFKVDGAACTIYVRQPTLATSNNAVHTLTLPITAATLSNQAWASTGVGTDNGTQQAGYLIVSSAGTVVGLNGLMTGNNTASGNSRFTNGQLTYAI